MLNNKVFTIGALVLLLCLMLYLALGLNQPTLKERPSYIPSSTPAKVNKIMELCPVCGPQVDPENSRLNIEVKGNYFYFDKQSCMEAFARDPFRYTGAKLKFKINIEPNPEVTATMAPQPPANTLSPVPAQTPAENLEATPEPSPTETEELPIEEFPLEDEPK